MSGLLYNADPHVTSCTVGVRLLWNVTDEVIGEWRGLRNEELYARYASPNIILMIKSRTMKWTGYVARMRNRSGAYRVLVGKPEGRRPLGRPKRRWEDLREAGWGTWAGSIWLRIGTGGGLL